LGNKPPYSYDRKTIKRKKIISGERKKENHKSNTGGLQTGLKNSRTKKRKGRWVVKEGIIR